MAALSEIEKLEARFNENPDGRFFAPLADAYRKAGRVDDALQVVNAGLTKHPDYLSAHIVLGRCLLDKKDDAAARAAFERVLGLDSENIIALKSLAEISERTGQPDEARRWLMRLLQVDAMNTEAEADLGRLGGPIAEAEAPAAEAAPSFGELSLEEPEMPPAPPVPEPVVEPPAVAASAERTVPVPAISVEPVIPKTLERPAVTPDMLVALTAQTTTPMDSVPPPPGFGATAAAAEPEAVREMEPPLALEQPFGQEAPAPAPEPSQEPPLALETTVRDMPAIEAPTVPSMDLEPVEAFTPPQAAEPMLAPAIDFMASAAPASEPAPLPEPAPEPEPAMASGVTEAVSATIGGTEPESLPLIMPEDVTPPEEMRRPSLKQVATVSPEPEVAEAEEPGEPLLTETMAELYLRQGMRAEAADVYRRLLARRPGDAALMAKLEAIVSPPAMSASALGTDSVGTLLKRIARAGLPTAPAAPAPAPPEGPSPLEAAFAEPAPEPTQVEAPVPATEAAPATDSAASTAEAPPAKPAGEPARPASQAFSLDQIFGGAGGGGGPAPSGGAPAAHPLGASFDEFFGVAPKPADSVRPRESESAKPGEDDLGAFNAWLHGLKR